MPRKLRVNKAKEQLSDMQWRFLKGESLPEMSFEAFAIECDSKGNNKALWNLHQDVILAEHVKGNPGTRPALWWQYTAPRLPLGTAARANLEIVRTLPRFQTERRVSP